MCSLAMGALSAHVDRPRLIRATERSSTSIRAHAQERYLPFWAGLTELMRQYHIRLPGNLWLVGKTLAMLEGIGRRLDLDYDLFEVSRPFVRRRAKWRGVRAVVARCGGAVRYMALPAPRDADDVDAVASERGARQSACGSPDWRESRNAGSAGRDGFRLRLSILTAAFIVGLALLLPATRDIPYGLTLTIAGFVASTLLGV